MSTVEYPRPKHDEVKKRGALESPIVIGGVGFMFVVCLAAVLMPVGSGAPHTAKAAACLSNLKQTTLNCLMYSADYDDKLPAAEKWMDDLKAYTKNEGLYHEPEFSGSDRYGYAYRLEASLRKVSDITDQDKYILDFDSELTQRNASSSLKTMPRPGRHGGRDCVGFLDGHAKAIPVK